MMRSLYSGVSGLKNHQTRMDVVGNNISNVNTTGFKSSRVTFADTLSQTLSGAAAPQGGLGGINPKQIGLGSAVSAIDTLFGDGSVQSTGVNTDLCLSGNGLFVVGTASSSKEAQDIKQYDTYYTRNGNFKFDKDGYYVNSDGYLVLGWSAKEPGGTFNTSDKNSIGAIKIQAGEPMAATATQKAAFSNNLNFSEPAISKITAIDSKSNKIIVDESNTGRWMCGSMYTSLITNSKVGFQNGIVLDAASGKYAYGGNYSVQSLVANATSGDTLSILSTSTNSYSVGDSLAALGVESITGTAVTLSDGSVLTNNSGTDSTVRLLNGDEFIVPSTSVTSFNKNTTPTLFVTSINGTNVSLNTVAGGGGESFSLTNNSGSSATATLANGDTITIPSSSGTAFSLSTIPTLYVTSVNGSIVTLNTNSSGTGETFTLNNNSGTSYAVGGTVTSTVSNISYALSNISKITYNSTAQIGAIAGQIQSASGNDNFSMTSGKITPASGVTVSSIDLSTDDGNTIEVSSSDVTGYQRGGTYEATINSLNLTMSDGTASVETSGGYILGCSKPVTTMITAYDAAGEAHNVTVYMTKTKVDTVNGNEWTISINLDGSEEITLDDGTVVKMSDTVVSFDRSGGYRDGSGNATMVLSNGSNTPQSIELDFKGLTQYSGSNTAFASSDGNGFGTLKSVSIDSNGVITGTYTNGLNVVRGQVAIAQFNNASGLEKTGNSLYRKSNNSGDANIGTVADLGCKVTPSALEMSNVDMASELTDMIVTQRGYQSNSKIITVSDELLETLINMKR